MCHLLKSDVRLAASPKNCGLWGPPATGTGKEVKLGGRGELLPDPRRDGERGRGGSDDVISGVRGI